MLADLAGINGMEQAALNDLAAELIRPGKHKDTQNGARQL